MGLFMGHALFDDEGQFSGNSLYNRELIGEWELVLPSFTKCSLGNHDILRIALVQWSYAFLH